MCTFFELENGTKVEMIMPRSKAAKMSETCFRGLGYQQAGNFFAWGCFRDFLSDPETRRLLTRELELLVSKQVSTAHRIELFFPRQVGWASFISNDRLTRAELSTCELLTITQDASALFLPVGRVPAPRTEFATLAGHVHYNEHWKFNIDMMYAGPCIGKLRGNITERYGIVFFRHSNSGY